MPFVQRDNSGRICGLFSNHQLGYAEEYLSDDDPELQVGAVDQNAAAERTWRDKEMAALIWLRDRHRDQLEIGGETGLTAEQFAELLVYMQALRDWPQSPGFPDSQARPPAPLWLADQPE
ncbi:phage tail assembly chaperone [Pseudomonas sp. MWU12-2345]|uniref:phage tail assembly chaperone n=1 Tax=Pseudomonas sp. MWU12-2345 TaxID=2928689 RepID=UPI00200C63AE|nr:phage tail assembly chaperone [Pseudomonas sp. MWU12-2345]